MAKKAKAQKARSSDEELAFDKWSAVLDKLEDGRRKRNDAHLVELQKQTLLLNPKQYDDSILLDLYVQTAGRAHGSAWTDLRISQQYAIAAQKLREELLRRMAPKS